MPNVNVVDRLCLNGQCHEPNRTTVCDGVVWLEPIRPERAENGFALMLIILTFDLSGQLAGSQTFYMIQLFKNWRIKDPMCKNIGYTFRWEEVGVVTTLMNLRMGKIVEQGIVSFNDCFPNVFFCGKNWNWWKRQHVALGGFQFFGGGGFIVFCTYVSKHLLLCRSMNEM